MKEYRVEIHHSSDYRWAYNNPAEEILWFTRVGLSRNDWKNIVWALRSALRNDEVSVLAEIYVDEHYYMIASLWRAAANHNLLHLDIVRGGKRLEIRRFMEVQKDA